MATKTGRAMSAAWGLWLLFGACSLIAVLTGCWAAAAQGVQPRALILNLAAWGFGAAVAAGLARLKRDVALGWLALATAGLALTLISAGLSGVHRWIGLGPLRLNGAELLLPAAVAACAGLPRRSIVRLLFPLAAASLLTCQPDVSQAAAVLGVAVVLLLTADRPLGLRIAVAMGVAAVTAIAALRPDPLAPVPEVEGIIGLAAALSPALAALTIATLGGAVLVPLAVRRSRTPSIRDAALALTAYLALTALAPLAGAYPVPLVGMGVSPILGAWLGVGWLMRLAWPGDGGAVASPATEPASR